MAQNTGYKCLYNPVKKWFLYSPIEITSEFTIINHMFRHYENHD